MLLREIQKCRICANRRLVPILDLGRQYLTSVFPDCEGQAVSRAPLKLVKCYHPTRAEHACGLVQLKHNFDFKEIYGPSYGYRSSLNQGMVLHLKGIAHLAQKRVHLRKGDAVVDIGSNDGTLLKMFDRRLLHLIGVDPLGKKFKRSYPRGIYLIPGFFRPEQMRRALQGRKAKIITSIAMFYDLSEPLAFMKAVASFLAPDGIWVMEQSYIKSLLENNAYDTVCHEHLEYYALRQIVWMARRSGLKIIDVQFNGMNGGSIRVTLAQTASPLRTCTNQVNRILREEEAFGLEGLGVYRSFEKRVKSHRRQLRAVIKRQGSRGRTVFGYGASTKGNVILQYCGFRARDIPFIAEINEEKFGRVTPGSRIPIISEQEALLKRPDYFLVLPWHFKDAFVQKKEQSGDYPEFIFPLPCLGR